MQLELSEGSEPTEKRDKYRRALIGAYIGSGQPQKAVGILDELLAWCSEPKEHLGL